MGQIRLRFLHFELRPAAYELRSNGEPVKLERIPMELLILLVERRGDLVTREMIIERLWGTGVFLETEHSINTAINKLRAVLLDQPLQPRCIQTVIGKGYRFIAEVESVEIPNLAVTTDTVAAEAATPSDSEARVAPELESAPIAVPEPLSATQAHRARKWVVPALSMIAITPLAFAVYFIHRRVVQPAPQPVSQFRSVAVLPFLDLSPGSNKEYLVDGLTDELITLLAQDNSIRVISRTSAMQFKGVRKPLPEIAAALGADAVVEGSVLRSENGIRVTAQLLDARRDQHLWAQSFEQNEVDSQAKQDRVVADIAGQILERLTGRTSPSLPQVQQQVVSASARDLYLRGGYFWHQRTLESLNKAIEYYWQAIRAEPDFAEAYAALGEAYVVLSSYGGSGPAKPLLQARAAAEKALGLSSRLGEAHTVLAAVKVDLDWDWTGAEEEFRRAVELDPNDSTAHHWFALHLARLHRYAEAETEIQRALELDPVSVIVQTDAAEVAYEARNQREAEARLRRALELDGNFPEAHLVLGKIYEEQGRAEGALGEMERASELFHLAPNVEALRGHALAVLGRKREAKEIAANLEIESQ